MNREKMEQAGIDYAGALDRFAGNEGLYQKYLDKFLKDSHTADARSAFDQKDYPEMLVQVHALKGFSGTLGFTPLYEMSCKVVNQLRGEQLDGLEENMAEMEERCREMIAAISD